MPAIAEKEAEKKEKITVPAKFQQLEKAKNFLTDAIAVEEGRSENILFNAPVWTLSAKDALSNKLKRMRKKIEDCNKIIAELRKMATKGETAEISKETKIVDPGIKEFAEDQIEDTLKKLQGIAAEINDYLREYDLIISQFVVRVGGRYYALIKELKKVSVMLGNEKQREIDALDEEYAEYFHAHDKMHLAILGDAIRPGWLKDLKKKTINAKNIKDYEMYANGVELFILTNKKQMNILGNHIKLQVEMRFKEAIQLADELLKTASTYA